MFFRDPFKLVPVDHIADIADKFTRNEIVSSNEIRQIIGMKPSNDPKADELRNKNINQSSDELGRMGSETDTGEKDRIVNDLLDTLEQQINDIIDSVGEEEEDEQ